jgi:hypothetical protein
MSLYFSINFPSMDYQYCLQISYIYFTPFSCHRFIELSYLTLPGDFIYFTLFFVPVIGLLKSLQIRTYGRKIPIIHPKVIPIRYHFPLKLINHSSVLFIATFFNHISLIDYPQMTECNSPINSLL